MMVDLAREAFKTNHFGLAADIYERTIQENGPTSELFLGLADSLARGGLFAKAFESYTNAYRFGKVTPEKLKHLVAGLIDVVKQDTTNLGNLQSKRSFMFTCGVCKGLLTDPVTLPCGHTFCRTCIEKDKTKTCVQCNIVHYRLKTRNLSSNVVLTNLVEKWFPTECRAARLKRKGNDYFSIQDYKNAIEMYSQAIEISKKDHLLLSNRCHSYALLDQFEEALKDSEQVVLLRPDWPKGYFRRGCALYGLERYEDAIVSFLQCLALDQNICSARDYLSKALDKILSVLPPDDPKIQALQQQSNTTLLQQMIEDNFSRPIFLPDITHTLSYLADNVSDAVSTASNFSMEPVPQVFVENSKENSDCATVGQHKEEINKQEDSLQTPLAQNLKSNSLSDVTDGQLSENYKIVLESKQTMPPSPNSRKRMRNPSTTQTTPLSPTHHLPQKVLKATSLDTGTTMTGPITVTAKTQPIAAPSINTEMDEMKPEQLNIEDLECGLCYRLFYNPVTTPCGHTFCRKCLDRCLDHTITCPMCKGNLAEYLAERRESVTDAVKCILETFFREEYAERCRINEEEMNELTRMGSDQQADIPVFVCILAFPTIPCPLHVFEPRYRLMVRQCMESGTRQFGMCMNFGDTDDDFSDYGCMLEIRNVQYFPDGRSVVDTIGGRRFKVLSRGKRDGYNTAKVEFISDKLMDDDEIQVVNVLQTEIHAMVKNWLGTLPTVHRTRITQHFGEIPDIDSSQFSSPNGPKWAWWAVAVLPMDHRVQMALLAMSSFRERLIALKKVLVYMNRRKPI